ncbi:hypothetical protein PAECIP112173_03420 [Paenibacillus sp. JJ-100]|nr:hypothetical protein PAECIP112173_03420 [Paenibacillus sp. JJ-100]
MARMGRHKALFVFDKIRTRSKKRSRQETTTSRNVLKYN